MTKLKVHIKSLKVAKFVFNFNACMLHAFIWLARADQGWRRSCRKRTQPCSQHTGEQHSHGAQAVASRERIHRWNLYWPISKPEAISWKIPTTTRMLLSGKTSFKVVILLLGFKLGVWCMDVWRTVMFFFAKVLNTRLFWVLWVQLHRIVLENPTKARGTSRPQRVPGGVSASLTMKQQRSEWYWTGCGRPTMSGTRPQQRHSASA